MRFYPYTSGAKNIIFNKSNNLIVHFKK